ncbi:Gldg family protein [Anaerostipes faecalis]|uniref:Gldg family protein n=1 Tax=Anaerostipes faecalis TaxID=2738446 RepID=UPI001C1DF952|nr:Gldg family protein [Anaerostipes faecalis]
MDKLKKLFQTNGSRKGSYSILLSVIVFGILLVVNLLIGQLPEKIRKIDISDTNIYEISSKSRKLVKNLDSNIIFYIIAEKDNTDDRIKTFVNKYAGMSEKIKVQWIDPVLHPSALTKYNTEENSIVVSCSKTDRQLSISFDDILVSDASYYGTSSSASSFDGDGQLTSAVNYVTNTKEYKAYYTSGHGESSLSSSVSSLLEKSRITTSELNLLSASSIPEDCDLLILNGLTSDLTKDETTVLSKYLKNGGKVVTLMAYTDKDMDNLYGLLEDYGLKVADGYIADTERCYQGNYYYLVPNLSVSGDMASGISSASVLMINSKGMTQTDPARDIITTESFMTTSENGYAITEDNQKQGSFILGATATESVTVKNSNGKKVEAESRLTVFGSNMLIDEQVTSSFSSLENLTLFTNAVTGNLDNADNISISPKSLEVSYNSIAHPGPFSILIIFIIPLALIVGGFVVWFRRRRR